MQPSTQPFLPDESTDYLVNLRGLAGDLELAMDAIAKRDLATLQQSIQSQQMTCARLAHLQHSRGVQLAGEALLPAEIADSELAFQVGEAIAAVLVLNRRYAALLKHSGETLRLFAGLFRSYQGSTQTSSGISANLQTWSCEV